MDIVNNFKKQAIDAVLALGTPKIMLLNDSHTTNIDTQAFISDVSINEIASANYTAGGLALSNVTSVIDTVNDRVNIDSDNPSWTELTATVKAACIYVDTGSPSTSPIIGITTFVANQVLSGQDLTLSVPTNGFLQGN